MIYLLNTCNIVYNGIEKRSDNVKELIKNKKVIIGIIIVVLLVVVGGIFLFTKNKKDDNQNKTLKEETYTMYVSINPLVKLTFKETYYECLNEKNEKVICSESDNQVIDYNLLNDDAKDIYKDIDFKGKDVYQSLVTLCDVARDNKIAFKSFEITSNYHFDRKNIIQKIKDGSKYTEEFDVFLDIQEHLNEEAIIEASKDEIKTYTVTLDTNGGSILDNRIIKENTMIDGLEEPTRNGYEFVEWQLNGKKFDVNSLITEDITLKAVWKEKEASQPNQDPKPNEDKTISKEILIEEKKATSTYSDNKVYLEANLYMYDYNKISITLAGPKSLVDKIDASNIKVGVDLSKYKDEREEYIEGEGTLEVLNKVEGVTYTIKEPKTKLWITVKKKVASTFDRINLNENILVSEWVDSEPCDGGFIMASNFKEVFGSTSVSVCDTGYCDITTSKFDELYGQLTVDETAKNAFIQQMENFKGKKMKNVANYYFEYTDGLQFNYSYEYLVIVDNIYGLGDAFTSNEEISKVLSSPIINSYYGPCGGGGSEPMLLNEELCNKYNLNCSRW